MDNMVNSDKNTFTGNDFAADLYTECKALERPELPEQIQKEWRDHFGNINSLLYQKLNTQDRDIFIRFFLKRFYKLETATQEEIKLIDAAFEKVKTLYGESSKDYIEFLFRNNKIQYMKNRYLKQDESLPENVLMNYYDVAHAFFLTEYEMADYNPLNGQTILDCGAAYGDTLLLFRSLYPDSRIHSFEASKSNVEIIRENAQMNRLENAVINKAYLYKDSEWHLMNQDNGRIVDEQFNRFGETSALSHVEKIQTMSVDDYVKENNLKDIGLIKFDIEGAEQNALVGSMETILAQKPLLYIPIYHLKSDIYEIPRFLESLNMPMSYRLKWTEKKVWGMDCVLFVRFK